jgi:hypothetical protein
MSVTATKLNGTITVRARPCAWDTTHVDRREPAAAIGVSIFFSPHGGGTDAIVADTKSIRIQAYTVMLLECGTAIANAEAADASTASTYDTYCIRRERWPKYFRLFQPASSKHLIAELP